MQQSADIVSFFCLSGRTICNLQIIVLLGGSQSHLDVAPHFWFPPSVSQCDSHPHEHCLDLQDRYLHMISTKPMLEKEINLLCLHYIKSSIWSRSSYICSLAELLRTCDSHWYLKCWHQMSFTYRLLNLRYYSFMHVAPAGPTGIQWIRLSIFKHSKLPLRERESAEFVT